MCGWNNCIWLPNGYKQETMSNMTLPSQSNKTRCNGAALGSFTMKENHIFPPRPPALQLVPLLQYSSLCVSNHYILFSLIWFYFVFWKSKLSINNVFSVLLFLIALLSTVAPSSRMSLPIKSLLFYYAHSWASYPLPLIFSSVNVVLVFNISLRNCADSLFIWLSVQIIIWMVSFDHFPYLTP